MVKKCRDLITRKVRYGQGPLIGILGPEFINNVKESLYCAGWIKGLRERASLNLFMNSNVYGTVGEGDQWYLENGILNTRNMMMEIMAHEVPIIYHLKDPFSYLYFNDLVSFFIIDGADELCDVASGLSCPIGIDVSTIGLNDADKLIRKIKIPQMYMTMMDTGNITTCYSSGNEDVFIVLDQFNIELEEFIIDVQIPFMISFQTMTKESYHQQIKVLKEINSSTVSMLFLGCIIDTGGKYKNDQITDINEEEPMQFLSEITNGNRTNSFFDSSCFNIKNSYSKMSNKIKSNFKLKLNNSTDETEMMEYSANFLKFAERVIQ